MMSWLYKLSTLALIIMPNSITSKPFDERITPLKPLHQPSIRIPYPSTIRLGLDTPQCLSHAAFLSLLSAKLASLP